jgi:Mn2+/Fe2+ NRAMP family transporter
VTVVVRRAIAVLPAAALLLAHVDATSLLLWSQTLLCFVLPAALVPLAVLLFRVEASRRAVTRPLFSMMIAATTVCVAVDVALLVQTL